MQRYERGHDTAVSESEIGLAPISFSGQPTPTAWLYNPDGTKRWQLPRLSSDGSGADSDQDLLLTTYQLRHDCEQAAAAYRHSRNTVQSPAEVNTALLAGLDASKAVDVFGLAHPDLIDYARITDGCSDNSWHPWFGCYPLTAAFSGCTGINTSRIY